MKVMKYYQKSSNKLGCKIANKIIYIFEVNMKHIEELKNTVKTHHNGNSQIALVD
jgi:hypothetical protein